MKLPWTKRLDDAKAQTEQARIEYERTLAQRPRAEAIAGELRNHRLTNGWTGTIAQIFGGS
jgi:hypothetical protein